MSAKSKEPLRLEHEEETSTDPREVYLTGGRTLRVSDDQLVEIRSPSGQLELRVKLTEEGPVLQMDSVRLELRASEAVEIASKRVAITATEAMTVEAGELEVATEKDVKVDAKGEVRIVGTMIYLN